MLIRSEPANDYEHVNLQDNAAHMLMIRTANGPCCVMVNSLKSVPKVYTGHS